MLYAVFNTLINKCIKVKADSPERALDDVCYYRDWKRIECRVIETSPQIRVFQQREEC
jgi:hypothetical protein